MMAKRTRYTAKQGGTPVIAGSRRTSVAERQGGSFQGKALQHQWNHVQNHVLLIFSKLFGNLYSSTYFWSDSLVL